MKFAKLKREKGTPRQKRVAKIEKKTVQTAKDVSKEELELNELFDLTDAPLSPERVKKAEDALIELIKNRETKFAGFPVASSFDHKYDRLKDLMDFGLNNIGDPFTNGHYKLNTKFIERSILE